MRKRKAAEERYQDSLNWAVSKGLLDADDLSDDNPEGGVVSASCSGPTISSGGQEHSAVSGVPIVAPRHPTSTPGFSFSLPASSPAVPNLDRGVARHRFRRGDASGFALMSEQYTCSFSTGGHPTASR